MPLPRLLLLAPLAAGLVLAPPVRAADLMTTCAPEIARYCSGVTSGRGRVSACLASRTALSRTNSSLKAAESWAFGCRAGSNLTPSQAA